MTVSFYNFRTGRKERSEPATITDEQARCYILQNDEMQALYSECRAKGFSVLESLHFTYREYMHDTNKLLAQLEARLEGLVSL